VEDAAFAGPPGGVRTAARPAAGTTPPKQNRLREQLRQVLARDLEPGEELRWYGVVYQYKAPAFLVGLFAWSILLPIVGPLIALMLRRLWDVGVTSERLVLRPDLYGLHAEKEPPLISVPLGDVSVLRKGRRTGRLIVTRPVEGLPSKFTLLRGKNVDELEALLGSSPRDITL
jgi:hypothetical protein